LTPEMLVVVLFHNKFKHVMAYHFVENLQQSNQKKKKKKKTNHQLSENYQQII